MKKLFITGATGFLGNALINKLAQTKQFEIYGLVRKGSEGKLPDGVIEIVANPFDAESFKQFVPKDCIYLHLIGVHSPAPWRTKAFRDIDLGSVKESIKAAQFAQCRHFIYISVAMESSVMFTYQANKKRAEKALEEANFNLTLLRPWYVIGPKRTWPEAFNWLYNLAEKYPNILAKIRKFRLVSQEQVLNTLIGAITHKPEKHKIYEIEDMLLR